MDLKKKILFPLAYYAGLCFLKTWRMKSVNKEHFDKCRQEGKSPVVAIWHDSLLPLSFNHYKDKVATIASDSKDGDIIAYILKGWGYSVSRGSSTRGGIRAAMNLIKMCRKEPMPAAITVDGPKGPRHEAKTGAVFVAKNLDKVIFVVTLKTKSYFRFNSWDKFILPKPFAKVEVHYSEPIYLSDEVSEEAILEDTKKLEKIMLEKTKEIYPDFL